MELTLLLTNTELRNIFPSLLLPALSSSFSLLLTLFHLGAMTATPEQASDANICPRGKFCVEGTDEPEPCPAGTFSNVSGKLHQLYQCAFSL